MPYSSEFVFNQLFLEHSGVRIFHTYRDDEENDPRDYQFGTAADTSDRDDDTSFDVRELPTWVEPAHPPYLNSQKDSPEELSAKRIAWDQYRDDQVEEKAIRAAIIAAIDGGHLQPFIDAAAAEERPQFITSYYDKEEEPFEKDGKAISVVSLSVQQLQTLLAGIHKTLLDRIEDCVTTITGDTMDFVSFDGFEVEYSDGAEYIINGVQLQEVGPTDFAIMILQGEDGNREGRDSQYLHHMDTDVLIDILKALNGLQEKVAKQEGSPGE